HRYLLSFPTRRSSDLVSARTGEGIPELLAVLVGLTQQYMQRKLEQQEKSTKGIVLEVKEEIGLGVTANIILIDGNLNKGDTIVLDRKSTRLNSSHLVI